MRLYLDFIKKQSYNNVMEIREIVAKNLTDLRKEENLTQTELAKKLNYSNKAISKWECGDALPDLDTLVKLASFYGVNVDYLISEHSDEQRKKGKRKLLETRGNRILIVLITTTITFLIALTVFMFLIATGKAPFWQIFVWAAPISCLAVLYLLRQWSSPVVFKIIGESILCWSLITAIYLQAESYGFWYMYFIGIPVQALIVLIHFLKTK